MLPESLLLLVLAAIPAADRSAASAPQTPVGVVSHVKILSDKVPDVSSLEAWKRSFIKDGMSDQEKALTAWRTTGKRSRT